MQSLPIESLHQEILPSYSLPNTHKHVHACTFMCGKPLVLRESHILVHDKRSSIRNFRVFILLGHCYRERNIPRTKDATWLKNKGLSNTKLRLLHNPPAVSMHIYSLEGNQVRHQHIISGYFLYKREQQ